MTTDEEINKKYADFEAERNAPKCFACWFYFIYAIFLLLVIVICFLFTQHNHWYFIVWALFSVYYIPRNILIIMSRNIAYHGTMPALDFPRILYKLYGKTIEEYFDYSQNIGRLFETTQDRRARLFFGRVFLSVLRMLFWLAPYYLILKMN